MSEVFEGILSIAGMKRGGEHAILVFHGSQGSVAKSHKGPKGKRAGVSAAQCNLSRYKYLVILA